MKLVLNIAHEIVEKDPTNYPDPGMILADDRIRKRMITRDQLKHILEAIQVTTQMILIINRDDYQFQLLAPPDTIVEALQRDAKNE